MKLPNLFILGAPKCGTTAIASYLAEHPAVFMTDPKEPHHYNFDHKHGSYKSRDHYLSLYKKATDKHKIVGEASVWYLYSQEAVSNILEESPDAKFVVMLRNPIQMAPSLYRQQRFSGNENAQTFEEAWNLQEIRRKGEGVPKNCSEPCHLLYKDACLLGYQYKRLISKVNTRNLLTIFHDDFKNDPLLVWERIMSFLDLQTDGRSTFPMINAAKKRRLPNLKKLNDKYLIFRQIIGFNGFGTGLFERLDYWNQVEVKNTSISIELKKTLKEEFESDILLLSNLTNRDLSSWLVE